MFKWGIIGAGRISSQFAKGVEVSEDMEVYAVASRSQAALPECHATKYYSDYEALASDPLVDAIYIGTIHPQHFPRAKLCLEKGKPVLCEKPATIHAGQLQEVLSLAQKNDTFFMEAMWSRMIPANQYIRELTAEKKYGEIQYLSLSFGSNSPQTNRRLFDVNQGGGALLDVGVYGISMAEYWMNSKICEFHGWSEKTEDTVDLYTSLQASFENYAKADMTFAINRNLPNSAYLVFEEAEIYVPYFWRPDQVKLFSPNGNFKTDRLIETVEFPLKGNGFYYEAAEVKRCVENGQRESSYMPWNESIHIMNVLDSIREKFGIQYPQDQERNEKR
jgi:dihydrodiol dehydrogenase / D-xylose 1-dehydrogenase (NADP)